MRHLTQQVEPHMIGAAEVSWSPHDNDHSQTRLPIPTSLIAQGRAQPPTLPLQDQIHFALRSDADVKYTVMQKRGQSKLPHHQLKGHKTPS